MNLNDAKKIMIKFLSDLGEKRPLNLQPSFRKAINDYAKSPNSDHYLKHESLDDSSYIFYFRLLVKDKQHPEAIVVRQNGKAFEVYGACATLFNLYKETLGGPLSGERWIGSGVGRYQLFDRGVVRWEASNGEDHPFPYVYSFNHLDGYCSKCMVAVIDIRGFTKWSRKQQVSKVLSVITTLEGVLQEHFAITKFRGLFLKGTGDGFMVVHEEYILHGSGGIGAEKVEITMEDFLTACAKCCKAMSAMLQSEGLSVGFGVDVGELQNVLILGRWDYIGDAVNNASKLQAVGDNEVIISEDCFEKLKNKKIIKAMCDIRTHSYVLKPL